MLTTPVDDNEDDDGVRMNKSASSSESVNMSPEVAPEEAVQFVREHLEEILMKSYAALCTPQCRYVELHELEREMKGIFRDTTPHELDPTDLNYVNFMQLLTMEFAQSDTVRTEIVHCDRRLMCLKRGEDYVSKTDKVVKGGRQFDPCPEIGTYLVINGEDGDEDTTKGTTKGLDSAVAAESDNDGDGAEEVDESKDNKQGDGDLDERIRESIAHLARCNVVDRMTPTDIWWHIKLIHSECSIRRLEAEWSSYRDGVQYRGQPPRGQPPPQNSFDEIAAELKQNGISGARILAMKWSDWEMLHELYRFDRDHQDFVDELIEDFFFPFLTAELLSNELATSQKNKFSRQCMFDSERVRPKLTLCVDYGLFAAGYPILHYLVKLADFEDCQRLLRLHTHLSVDEVVGEYSAMHIAAWRGKFKLLSLLTKYGGDPLKINAQGETAFAAGQKHAQKLKWFYTEFPQYQPK